MVSELGITRSFGLGDIGQRNQLSGWAWPEENHNWNDGVEAAHVISLASVPNKTCILTLEARPYLGTGIAHQDVTLYFNGYRVGFWRLDKAESHVLSAEIEPEFWFKRQGAALGKCVWHVPNSTAPSAISPAQDNRQLGLCFQSITLAAKASGKAAR